MSTARTWLVAYDFSDHAKLAFDRAREQLSALGGGRIVLVHVHAPASDGVGIDIGTIGPGFAAREDAICQEAERNLAALVASLSPAAGGPISYEPRVVTGRIADQIVALGHEVAAEQLVVGSHGRRGFERFLIGSVAERVLRLANGPVLIVKS